MRHVTNKHSHLGRAGQFATMAEILARGWNVAIPEVDVGDDVFVARDDASRLTRVQVKTSAPAELVESGVWETEAIKVASRQLFATVEVVPLMYVFAVPFGARWEFVVMPRDGLAELWRGFESQRSARIAQGLRPRGRPRLDPRCDSRRDRAGAAVFCDRGHHDGWARSATLAQPLGTVRADPCVGQRLRCQRTSPVS